MRKYYRTYLPTNAGDVNDIWEDIVELKEDEKANNNLLRDKIDALLNHYNGYYCGKIIAWSLIEE